MGETTTLVKFKTFLGFSPFSILFLTSVVSPRHSIAVSLQNALDPPILFARVAVFLWPGAFRLHSADEWLHAPCVWQYFEVSA